MPSDIDGEWPGDFGNWNRWDNDKGAVNLISSENVLDAIALVESGTVVDCSRPLVPEEPLEGSQATEPGFTHKMISAWESTAGGDVQASSDQFSMRNHGMMNTHIDALCHVGYQGRGFNGRPFEEIVDMEQGGKFGAITDWLGTITRGVFVDIPNYRDVDYVEPGDSVKEHELREVAPELRPGDALIVRTGRWNTPPEAHQDYEGDPHGRWPGLHPDCLDFIAEKDVALVGTDTAGDTLPSPIEECVLPIHVLAEAYLGVPLIHNMELQQLVETCREEQRDSFMFIVNPLNIPGGTGSPVSPVAVF